MLQEKEDLLNLTEHQNNQLIAANKQLEEEKAARKRVSRMPACVSTVARSCTCLGWDTRQLHAHRPEESCHQPVQICRASTPEWFALYDGCRMWTR